MEILTKKFFVLEKLEDKWVDNHFCFFIRLLENDETVMEHLSSANNQNCRPQHRQKMNFILQNCLYCRNRKKDPDIPNEEMRREHIKHKGGKRFPV